MRINFKPKYASHKFRFFFIPFFIRAAEQIHSMKENDERPEFFKSWRKELCYVEGGNLF